MPKSQVLTFLMCSLFIFGGCGQSAQIPATEAPLTQQSSEITPRTKGGTLEITPRTKGGTLEITPRTKGSTHLKGWIELPAAISPENFEISLRQENRLLNTTPIMSDSQGQFQLQGLSLNSKLPLSVEAKAAEHHGVTLMKEVMIPEHIPAELELRLSVTTTAAVYASDHLNLPPQETESLMLHQEVLEPIRQTLTKYLMKEMPLSPAQSMVDMPPMTEALESTRQLWLKMKHEETGS